MGFGYFRTKITDASTTADGYHGYTIEERFHSFFFIFNFCKKEEKSIMAGQFSKRKKVSMSRKTFALKNRYHEMLCEARYLLNLFSGVI